MTSGQVRPTYAELLQGFSILMEYWESIPDDEKPKVDKRLKEASLDARVVATVHDSLELISSEKDLSKCLGIVYDELVNYPHLRDLFGIKFDVPLSVDIEVGRSFGDGVTVCFENEKPTNIEEVFAYLCEH